ncbi:MAG: formylglycine-generating enzyme family protein [Deltaproteobacteria bacterium]|nr:formylglycine-generating enzyme family protein [Deltaproteobacteria bacterium]
MARLLPLLLAGAFVASPAPLHQVGPGIWRPLYPAEGEQQIAVDAFLLEERPVTNREYAAFVSTHPEWQRGKVPALFSDPGYLSQWESPDSPGDAILDQPVTHVSWWAARSFCEARGKRLPYEREWELAAMASATKTDASGDPEYLAQILAWYGKPGGAALENAGSGEANAWGVRDLHGMVWEWVEDFQSALVTADNREDGAVDLSRFCGAGAVSAEVKEDYAAFMRIAFRSSLSGQYTTKNLGFRCAADAGATESKPPKEK